MKSQRKEISGACAMDEEDWELFARLDPGTLGFLELRCATEELEGLGLWGERSEVEGAG